MENILLTLAVLACPVGMGVMMLFMGKGMLGSKKKEPQADRPPSLADLKGEQARVDEAIARLERDDRESRGAVGATGS